MKEKERGKNDTEKREWKKKKIPMQESNPRPLNLQPAITITIATASGIDCTYNNNNTDIYRSMEMN